MSSTINNEVWYRACMAVDVPENGGVCVLYKSHQIAVFNFTHRNEWFATQNLCPHKQQMAISRGLLGSQNQEPKIACPFHKKTFSLTDGRCLSGEEDYRISTYAVQIHEGAVYINIASLEDSIHDYNNNAYAKIDN